MPNLVIQPGAGRRQHRLCFSGNKATLPSGDCYESFLSKTSQPSLTSDDFVFHLRVSSVFCSACLRSLASECLTVGKRLASPKVRRRLEAVHSQFVQLLLSFGEDDRTTALAE